MNESSIWTEFAEDDLTLFYTLLVESAQLGARGSTLQGAHSQEWRAGAGCWLAALPGLWAGGLSSSPRGLLFHGWLSFLTVWRLSQAWASQENKVEVCDIFMTYMVYLGPSVTTTIVTSMLRFKGRKYRPQGLMEGIPMKGHWIKGIWDGRHCFNQLWKIQSVSQDEENL